VQDGFGVKSLVDAVFGREGGKGMSEGKRLGVVREESGGMDFVVWK
jgi:hypothetical protein